MGVLNDVPKEGFDNLREIESKHGRVAVSLNTTHRLSVTVFLVDFSHCVSNSLQMLAVTGYLTTAAGIRFPGAGDIPDGFAAWGALASTDNGKFVLLQMAAFFVVAEAINRDAFGKAEFPGDYRNGALDFGWDKQSDAWKKSKRTIELNQGRAAQMGILGLMVHEAMGSSILPGGYLPGH